MQVTGNNADWEQLEDRVLPHITGDLSATGHLPSVADVVKFNMELGAPARGPTLHLSTCLMGPVSCVSGVWGGWV